MNKMNHAFDIKTPANFNRIDPFENIHILMTEALKTPQVFQDNPIDVVMVRDDILLQNLSSDVRILVDEKIRTPLPALDKKLNANIFFNAAALLVLYSQCNNTLAASDCWFASENLISKAHLLGLNTSISGICTVALNTSEWKSRLGVSEDKQAISPIIIQMDRVL